MKRFFFVAFMAGACGGCGALDWNRLAEPRLAAGGTQVTTYVSPSTGMAVQGMTVGNPSGQIIASAEAERISADAEYRRAEAEYRRAEAAHLPSAEARRIDADSAYVRARAECVANFGPAQCEGYYGFGAGFGTQYLSDPVYAETLRGMWAGGQDVATPSTPGQTSDPEARAAIRELSEDQTALRNSLRRHYGGSQ